MRVLMLGWELPPNNSGGLGVACLQLSRAMAAAGADIDFILPYPHEPKYDFMRVTSAHRAGSSIVNRVNAYDSFRYILEDGSYIDLGIHDQQTAYALMVGKLVEQMEFDVIHAHDWLTFRAALLAREKSGVPLILHVHSIERDRAGGNPGNPLVREIEATSMLLADHVIAVSQRTKDLIIEDYAIPADRIEVIHNSTDVWDVEALDTDNAYGYLADMKACGWKVIVNVGRLTVQKGLPHLVRAAAEVVKREPKTIFLLVGDGEQRDELIELAAELGISKNVVFTGFQRGKRWRDAYSVADLFVMPSVSEPFGLTPFEATAYGTPSLISKQSGVSEVFRSCLKVDFWDEHEMANQIVGVIRNQSLAAELHANAWQEYQKLSWSKAADKIMDRYRHFTQRVAA
ncbi:MAG: putative Glycosyl transferase, group 1 family [Candidatus Saccharibacteria bacterium]|nr:putative Glycosyl transferase, group 1 family [Candidatus Saccharibacteria bacterium]